MERSFAWLGIYRRLLIRREHLFRIYRSFFSVALLLVCLKRLTREQRVSQERTYVGGASPRAVARLGRARRADRGGRRLDAGGFVLADPFETILRSISASYLLSAWARVSDVLAYYHLAPADLSWGWLHPGETLIAGLEQRATPSDYVGWTSRDLKRFDGDSRFRAIDAELAQGQPALRCASSWRSLKWSIAPHDVASGLRLLEALSTDESTDWAPVWILQHAGAGSGAWIEIARALDASDQHALDQALAQAQATYSPVGYKVVLRGFASFIAQPGMSLAIRFPQAPSG